MNKEELENTIFSEPIETREGNYRDGYIEGIYRAKNIIDAKQKEIERLQNIIEELEKYIIGQRDKYLKNKEYWTSEVHNYILDKLKKLKENNK